MKVPNNLHYTNDHEWLLIKNSIATIGITDFAQHELGDIIFIEFPSIGEHYKYGDSIGTIEAVKTVADLFSPIEGDILEINMKLEDNPASINTDPYGDGWIVKLNIASNELPRLLTPNQYKDLIQ